MLLPRKPVERLDSPVQVNDRTHLAAGGSRGQARIARDPDVRARKLSGASCVGCRYRARRRAFSGGVLGVSTRLRLALRGPSAAARVLVTSVVAPKKARGRPKPPTQRSDSASP